MSRTPIIILAHGSRHPQADGVVEAIARAAAEIGGTAGEPRLVRTAHLDFSPATLTNVAHLIAAEGYEDAVVVPLLFTRAFHMRHDVPTALQEAEAASGLNIRLADGLGTEKDLAELIARFALEQATQANNGTTPPVERLALYSVGSSVRGANESVADFATVVAGEMGKLLSSCVEGRAFVATGPQAIEGDFHSFINEHTLVQPLFVAPGTLWEKQRCRMPQLGWRSTNLGTALAPLVLKRADAVIQA